MDFIKYTGKDAYWQVEKQCRVRCIDLYGERWGCFTC